MSLSPASNAPLSSPHNRSPQSLSVVPGISGEGPSSSPRLSSGAASVSRREETQRDVDRETGENGGGRCEARIDKTEAGGCHRADAVEDGSKNFMDRRYREEGGGR